MPKVSTIIPTYNSSAFIERAVGSVLRQTFTDWELLIVDDGSTDDTVELVTKFIKQDSRIKLFRTPQNSGGPALPKNIGIENARGEYVAFLDHDDEWLPEKLAKQLKVFEDSKDLRLGLVSCYVNVIDNKKNKILYKYNRFYIKDNLNKIINSNYVYSCSSVMTKLSILKIVGSFDTNLKISDDWDMWIRISKAQYSFGLSPEYLLNYFVHNKNVSYGNNNFFKGKEFIIFYEKHKDLFIKYNSLITGCFYYQTKQYKLARKYYIKKIMSFKLTAREITKSIGYILLSYFPSLEKLAQNIWARLKF